MSITVTLTSEELAQIKQITKLNSDCEAVEKAVREFRQMAPFGAGGDGMGLIGLESKLEAPSRSATEGSQMICISTLVVVVGPAEKKEKSLI